jgi:hypothetical protein
VGPRIDRPSGFWIQLVDSRWVPEAEKEKRYPFIDPDTLILMVSITMVLSFVNTRN